MRRVLLFLACLVSIEMGCGQSGYTDPPDTKVGPVAADELEIGEPISHANLTIFPLSSRIPKNANRFITLNEGLKAGTVEVMEMGTQQRSVPPAAAGGPNVNQQRQVAAQTAVSGPNVNRLLVVNRADKPLYLMPGEIIIGGQQDRAIGHEYVIAPSKEPVPIDVFCVEHGRWHDRVPLEAATILEVANSSSPVADSIALSDTSKHSTVVQQSASGSFSGSVGSVSKEARLAVQGKKNQQAVWDRVAQTNQSSGMMAPSGAFTGNYVEAKTIEQLDPYIKALNRPVSEHSRIVGVLVAINGQVETMDIFESTPLFRALWPKLLKSYALDAANAPKAKAAKLCTREQAQLFLAKATAARSEVDGTDENLVVTTRSTADLICFSVHEKTKSPALKGQATGAAGSIGGGMGGGMGGFGGSVHTSGFAK